MKKTARIFVAILILIIATLSCAFASEKFLETRTYTYRNDGVREINNAYIELFIGQKDVVGYEKDDYIKVNPKPDEIIKDEYGNLFAHYDVSTYKPGRTITITIEKAYTMDDYDKDISVRSESTPNDENRIFVEPQERVNSDDATIIAKAKDITYGLTSDYKRVKAIFEFVNTNMKYNTNSSYANKGSISALNSLSGVCEEYATLFAALCRAIDVPCKLVDGCRIDKVVDEEEYSYVEPTTGETVVVPATYKYQSVSHVWNEVYFDDYGWVPVDTCVVYTSSDGKQYAYLNSFCKIKGSEYVANGLYNMSKPLVSYDSNFKELESKTTIEPYESKDVVRHKFEDLKDYSWAEESINTLYDMNVVKGYSDTEYGPGGNITRIEFITMLARVLKNLNYTPTTTGQIYYYLDYDKNHYSKREYDFLMRCLEDVNPGYSYAVGYYAMDNIFGSTLNMNKPITRGEVVALMDGFLKYKADYSYTFSDIVGNKFQASIIKSATNGLIKGYEDGTFRPNNAITRAEIAVIFDRYIGVKDYVI